MTEAPKPVGLAAFEEPSGFEGEDTMVGAAADSVAGANGHDATAASTPTDPLRAIATNEAFPDALRITAERLLLAEATFNRFSQHAAQHSDEFAVGEALAQFRSELEQHRAELVRLNQVISRLSQQQAVQEFLAERNARAAALDLAIKALPEASRTSEAIVAHAEAFLGWLKSGTQA